MTIVPAGRSRWIGTDVVVEGDDGGDDTGGGGEHCAGALRVRGAYIPQQASESEAAAYFTVTNTGDAPDTLTAVSTPADRH